MSAARSPRNQMSVNSMNKEEALNTARRLVQEAVDVADRAGIDASDVVAPYCAESAATQADGDAPGSGSLTWCGVPVIIDNDIEGLFEMSEPDDDREQEPAFLVTQSTEDLVRQDFERYKPSLERMAKDWQEDKNRFLFEKKSDQD
jgi:hypothetical protein